MEEKDNQEYKLQTADEIPKEEQDIWEYQQRIAFSPEQEEEVAKICEANLTFIEKQRQEDDSENRWSEHTNQYWGVVQENPNMLFNTHVFLTLKHGRRVKSRLYQAFFESDPIFSASPTPGSAKKGGFDTAELQEQFLDYEFDSEIIIKSPMRKVFHQAVILDGGVLKLPWERNKEWTRHRQIYKGTVEGLSQFLEEFPDAREKYPQYVRQLEEKTDITLMVDKHETIYDAPRPYYVDFADFFIDLKTEGLLGLRKAKFYAERQRYNWDELQEEVEEKRFDENKVEDLSWVIVGDKAQINPNYLTEEYIIFECNLFYDLKKDGKPKRIVVWYCRDKRKILNAIHFPYEHGRPYYIPFFLTEERPGWHQPGLARVLQPQNIIANATTNFILDKAFYEQTPLLRATPNTSIASQLLAKTWKIGDPLIAEKNEVEKFDLRTGNLSELMGLSVQNEHQADETSGIGSAHMSGKADPTDPDAPARKTMALIHETNINIRDYVLCILPSFQELAYQLLQLFAQFRKTAQFRLKKASVLGKDKIFKEITPEQLRLRTNITPNAMSFSFDKLNQKRENLALVSYLTQNPVAMQFLAKMPQAQWNLFQILIKSWGEQWANKIEEIWPSEEQVDEYMVGIQKRAMDELYKAKVAETRQRMNGQPGMPGGMPGARPMEGMNV